MGWNFPVHWEGPTVQKEDPWTESHILSRGPSKPPWSPCFVSASVSQLSTN
jgi:hypothetical protein